MLWVIWLHMMLYFSDTEFQGQSVIQIVISTAAQKSNSLAFIYASQALNNSFFLDNLVSIPQGSALHTVAHKQ